MVEEQSNSEETMALQLAMAFGQGAGTMLATPAALVAALAPYRESLHDRLSEWDTLSLKFIEFSRALGTLSATHAAQAGRLVIDEADVEWALPKILSNTLLPLGACGC